MVNTTSNIHTRGLRTPRKGAITYYDMMGQGSIGQEALSPRLTAADRRTVQGQASPSTLTPTWKGLAVK
jgi:hypothetical protein